MAAVHPGGDTVLGHVRVYFYYATGSAFGLSRRSGRDGSLEAEDRYTDATIRHTEALHRMLGWFRMGPFELMDLIGNDVNFAVTPAVYEAVFFDPRSELSLTQRRLVEANMLGHKTGRGYYDYRDGAVRPEPLRRLAAPDGTLRA